LKKFIDQDSEPIIAYYGGEPLLNQDFIRSTMEILSAKHFVLQTNGLLLHKIDADTLNRFDTILVSIDGRREITDYYRGEGVYDAVIENTRYLRSIGFRGDIIARMTISGMSDIYLDVMHLVGLELFDHIHWQLDVFFDAPPHRYTNFNSWIREYDKGIEKLLDFWVRKLREGKIVGLVPFQGILNIILRGKRCKIPCGAGVDAFAISTSGKIFACPISPSDDFYLGDILSSKVSDLPYKITIGEPCTSCDYYDVCGGRCLYANKTMLWGEKLFFRVCKSTKHLIDLLEDAIPVIDNIVLNGKISWNDILYPPYNNTTEIIP